MTPDVSVIIMAYNEDRSIRGVLDELDREMAQAGCSYETIVVNDGSSDSTEREALVYAQSRPWVQVVSHRSNLGIGEVYRTGFGAAAGALVSFLPADGQFPARIIRDFVPLMQTHDLVLGYLPNQRRSAVAKLLSAIERSLYTLLFGRMPRFQGILMFKRGAAEALGVTLGGRGWQVLMELIIRAQRAGYRIVSVPNELRPRTAGVSKVTNFRHIWANFRQALAIRWRLWRSPVRVEAVETSRHGVALSR